MASFNMETTSADFKQEVREERRTIHIQYGQPPLLLPVAERGLPEAMIINAKHLRDPARFVLEKILNAGKAALPIESSGYANVIVNAEITAEALSALAGLFNEMENEGGRNSILIAQIHSSLIAQFHSSDETKRNSLLQDLQRLFGMVRLTLLYDSYGLKRDGDLEAFRDSLGIAIRRVVNNPSEIVIPRSIGTLSYGGYRGAQTVDVPKINIERYVLHKGIRDYVSQTSETNRCTICFGAPESLFASIRDHFSNKGLSWVYLGATQSDVEIVRLYQALQYQDSVLAKLLFGFEG